MWYIAVLAIVLTAGAFAGASRLKSSSQFQKDLFPVGTGIRSLESLSMEQINTLLARLEQEEPPEPVFGAMCYGPVAIPDSAEYICPDCGEKTIYNGNMSSFFQWELETARRLAEYIDASTDFSVQLDETLYCDYCSPEQGEDPSMLLRVMDESGVETVNRVTVTDLRMLDSFLQGRLYWVTDNDGQQPLKDHAERMALLLGM